VSKRDEQNLVKEERGRDSGGGVELAGRKKGTQTKARQGHRAKQGIYCNVSGRSSECFSGAVRVTGTALDGGQGHGQCRDVCQRV